MPCLIFSSRVLNPANLNHVLIPSLFHGSRDVALSHVGVPPLEPVETLGNILHGIGIPLHVLLRGTGNSELKDKLLNPLPVLDNSTQVEDCYACVSMTGMKDCNRHACHRAGYQSWELLSIKAVIFSKSWCRGTLSLSRTI